jgi:hypothetical protein
MRTAAPQVAYVGGDENVDDAEGPGQGPGIMWMEAL